MNLAFTDISSSFANIVQEDISKQIMSDPNNSGLQKPQFAAKLNKILGTRNNSEKPLGFLEKPEAVSSHSENLMDSLLEKMNKAKGTEFIAALQNFFLILSNQDLKNASIDADGLAALKKMLLKAGYNESDVNDVITELLENKENHSISLSDLFDKLFDLSVEEKPLIEDDSGNFIEISAMPFLESLMKSLKITDEKIQEILTLADRGEKGLDLDFILTKLQELQKESFYTGNQYKTQENDKNFSLLLQQFDIGKKDSKGTSFTLADLVDSLEKLRAKKAQQHNAIAPQANIDDKKTMGDEKPFDTLEALFNGLKFKNSESQTPAFVFSEGQIKNQFKNQLFIQDDIKIEKTDLFSLNSKTSKHKLDTAIKQGFEGIESLLGGKKSSLSSEKSQTLDSKEFLKQLKSEEAKVLDRNPISAMNVKSTEAQSELNIIKTKATFKNLPNFVNQQVSKNLVRAINQGESILRIQLKPPELGRLLITLDNTGSNIKINIMTENSTAKEILTSNSNELRTILSNSGVNLERFEVDMSSDFRQSMADAKNQAGHFSKKNKNKEKALSDSAVNENINETTSIADLSDPHRSVHLVA